VLPTYNRAPLSFVQGEGSWLVDDKGRRFLDLGAGIAVNILGHANPVLVKALTDQAGKLWHTSNLYHIPNQEELAAKLVDATFADTVFFTNSGTEAVECALKMARKYHFDKRDVDKIEIVSFEGCFHGRSTGAIAISGSEKMTKGFGPLMEGGITVPLGDADALREAVSDKTAAIIVEPVQGEGGITVVPTEELRAMRALCDEVGALLIFDEVQCGVGRTGSLFAHDTTGVTPDIMAVAKGIGGGFPLGACLATEEAASGMVAGTHGSTYGGNPLACAIGLAVLDVVTSDGFLSDVERTSSQFVQGLNQLVDSHPDVFTAVRGKGLMLGLECKVTNLDVVAASYDAEMLVVPAAQNVIRILPALNITQDDVAEAIRRLDAAATAIEAKLGPIVWIFTKPTRMPCVEFWIRPTL
jgi:acetylornithine/N-succinyldiaminopimelate aminotransferase